MNSHKIKQGGAIYFFQFKKLQFPHFQIDYYDWIVRSRFNNNAAESINYF